MLSRADIALRIVLISHRLYEKGFVTATDGNVSVRLPNGNVLITPSALNKGQVSERDLVEVSLEGTPVTLSRKPSSELGMHLFIYRQRPDVKAIVHAHPTTATAFAAARLPLPDRLLPEVIVGIGAVPLAVYATPSTTEVAESLAPHVMNASVILLTNHGVVAYGSDLDEAYFKLEKTEHAAQITLIARLLGGEVPLSDAELGRLKALGTGHYGNPIASGGSLGQEEQPLPDEQMIKQMIREILGQSAKTKGS